MICELFVSLLLLILIFFLNLFRTEETYPSEATRAELSVKLDLSDRQLQMWFCHRRLKDKKDGQAKKPAAPPPAAAAAAALSSLNELPAADDGSGSGSGSGCSPYSESRRNVASGSSSSRDEVDEYEQPRLSAMVRRAVACIEGQLGEPLREDGPVLGMEFDPLPPGAFGTPIGILLFVCHSHNVSASDAYCLWTNYCRNGGAPRSSI